MTKTPRFFRSILICSLIFVGSFILLASLFTYRRISQDLKVQSRQVLLNRVILIHESISSTIDEAAGRLQSIMSFRQTVELSEESYRRVIDNLNKSIPGCRRIWIMQPDGAFYFDSLTNREYLERTGWWKSYADKLNSGEPGVYQHRYDIAVAPEEPYRDNLDLNTIYPVAFYLLSGTNVISIAFMEIDLTAILMAKIRDFHLNLSDRDYPLEFSVYDRQGSLLETSANIPLVAVPILDDSLSSLEIPYEDDRFLNGSIFTLRGDDISVFTRDSKLGLIFGGSLPQSAITGGARRAAYYILGIGIFCIIAVLGLGLLLLRTYHKMKHYEAEQATARFQSLQNKMNPHFLFNTLDSLVGVAEKQDYPVLMDMLKSLSFILHMNLRTRQDIIPLSTEIRYIESYIGLQRIRYRDQFSFRMNLPAELANLDILRFCLQPLVENCFVHGVALRSGFVGIEMAFSQEDGKVLCDIRNTGPAVREDKLQELREKLASEWRDVKAPRLGLMSIHRRLRILYGQEYGLELPDSQECFHVRVILPALL